MQEKSRSFATRKGLQHIIPKSKASSRMPFHEQAEVYKFFTRDIVIPMYSHHINASNQESRSSLSVKKPCLITHHSSAFHLSASSPISTILLLDRSTTHTLARILCAYDNVHPSTVHSNAAQTPSLGQRHQFHPGINEEKETVAMHARHAPML
jgi:hypothetical protein